MKQNKKIIVANWKMNPEKETGAIVLAKALNKKNVIICPPFVYLSAVSKILKSKNSKTKAVLGAQNFFTENSGSYTGQISIGMLKNFGVKFVILGHSENRITGESSEYVNLKIKSALKAGITPIVCIGEKSRDEQMSYLNFVSDQIKETFSGISKNNMNKIIIAYEPIWAIGKNADREATPEESNEMMIFIKKVLSDMFGLVNIKKIRILYGGSVGPKNAALFLKNGGADGLLVGRASLDPKKFNEIVYMAENAIN